MQKIVKNLMVSLSIALGALTIIVLIVGPSKVIKTLKIADPKYILFTFLLWLTSVFLESLAFMIGSKFMKSRISFPQSVVLIVIGRFFNAITPFSTGGQPAQAYVMNKKSKIDFARGIGTLVIKFLIYQMVITIYGVVVLIFAYPIARRYISNIASLAFIGFAINSLVMLLILLFSLNEKFAKELLHMLINILAFLRIIKSPEKTREEITVKIRNFKGVLGSTLKYPLQTLFMALITLGQVIAFMSMAYTIYKAFEGCGHSFMEILGIQSILSLLVSFVPTPGASGAQEGMFFIMYKNILTSNVGGALVTWRFFSYYIHILVGAMFLPYTKSRKETE